MPSVRYSFSLDPTADARLVAWLEAQHNTSAAIRSALLAYLDRPTAAELEAKLDQVLNRLNSTPIAQAANDQAQGTARGEPEAAKQGLDAMIAQFKQEDQ